MVLVHNFVVGQGVVGLREFAVRGLNRKLVLLRSVAEQKEKGWELG